MTFRLLLAVLFVPWLAQSSGPLSLAEYRQLVADAAADLSRPEVVAAAPETVRQTMAGWADRLSAVTFVALADGTRAPVDPADLVQALRATPPDRAAAVVRLTALRDALDAWRQKPPGADTFTRLQDILARPEFQYGPQTPPWLEDLLRNIVQALAPALRVMAQILPWLAAILLGIVLVVVLRGALGNLVSEARTEEGENGGDDPETAAEARDRAQERAAAGDYRTAVRYMYLATLLLLDERGLLRYDRARTNREVLRDVSGNAELAERLAPVVATFDDVWYGVREPDEQTYERYVENTRQVRDLKPRP